jgi:hypothetical protein
MPTVGTQFNSWRYRNTPMSVVDCKNKLGREGLTGVLLFGRVRTGETVPGAVVGLTDQIETVEKPRTVAGSSLDDLRNFPDEARRAAGFGLHAFQKKTRKTSRHDIDLARQWYRQIGGNL